MPQIIQIPKYLNKNNIERANINLTKKTKSHAANYFEIIYIINFIFR